MIKKILSRFLLAAGVLATPFLAMTARAGVGDVYETNEARVLLFHTLGGTPGTFATGFTNPKNLVFDGNGHLFVADPGKNAVIQFTVPDATGTTYISDLSSPTGVAIDINGNLFVSEAGTGNILKFDKDRNK